MLTRRDVGVHRIGREVNITGPCDRALVHKDSLEEIHIEQRRKDAGQFLSRQLHASA